MKNPLMALIACCTASVLAGQVFGQTNNKAPMGPVVAEDQPIEISADQLEVQQEKNLAIFRGRVEAIQGTMRLKSDELHVFYSGNNNSDTEPAAPPSAGAATPGQGQSIKKIDARGNVFVSSPKETAKGNDGTYDVVGRKIVLTGAVVLTQGQSVIRGQRLTMNLATGKSVVDSSAQAGGGRVQGIFVPEKNGDKNKPGAKNPKTN